ncbi:tyrosine-type recombinase/integrase [Paraburkholderia sp. SIMBA_030]|uniref:tyrosine-type recombinase/integrase n=1 Tax=Paraburkholderia sp. SIMBA_030 TaxID=3085773 RepID=UPI003979EE40
MKPEVFKVGDIWHYRFALNGKRVQRTTRQKAKRKAQEIADDAFEAALLRTPGRSVIPTLRQLAALWIEANSWAESAAHVKNISVFCRHHMFDLADLRISELTTEAVEVARRSYAEDHAPASVNQWVKTLKLLVNWAKRRKMIKDVSFDVGLLKVQKKPRAILPPNLALRWLDEIDKNGKRDVVSVAARLGIGLGLRESEIITARWEWMDWERQSYAPGQTKDRKSVPIPVPDWLLDYLTPRRQASGLIISKPNGRPLSPGFMRNAMLRANQACGAPHITPHRLRGTFATMLGEAGTPIQEIQRVLRHKSILTTAAYLEPNPELTRVGQRHIAARFGLSSSGEKHEDAGEKVATAGCENRTSP